MKHEIRLPRLAASAAALALVTTSVATAQTFDTSAGPVEVTKVVADLDDPWAFAFLPDFADSGAMLITEKDGTLRLFETATGPVSVAGVPDVAARGQGGLLDVALAVDFAETGLIYLSYASRTDGGSQTRVAQGRLVRGDAPRLEDVEVIFRQEPAQSTSRHFGSRILVADDGSLFVTIGDRGERSNAQDLTRHQGKIVRILPDGSPHPENPFIGNERGWREEIFSYGHRNPQGAVLTADGTIWTTEHGAQGGDEVNRPEAGMNYGWATISYGEHYGGGRIGTGTEAEGMEQPVYYWDPSIAPSGLTYYTGTLFPEWQGDLIGGALKYRLVFRLDMEDGRVVGEERLLTREFGRIRDVRSGPDGAIWFAAEGRGSAIYRMAPTD
ncbi:MAG: PQQ-dependent sugar dehydrogenase [Pseudomonadota bacterium]